MILNILWNKWQYCNIRFQFNIWFTIWKLYHKSDYVSNPVVLKPFFVVDLGLLGEVEKFIEFSIDPSLPLIAFNLDAVLVHVNRWKLITLCVYQCSYLDHKSDYVSVSLWIRTILCLSLLEFETLDIHYSTKYRMVKVELFHKN